MNNNGFKLYLTEAQLSRYYFPAVIFTVSYFLQAFIRRLIGSFVNTVFVDFQVDWLINTLCLMYFSIGLFKLVTNILRYRYPTLLSIFYWILVSIGYILIFRFNDFFYFFKLFSTDVYLFDVVMLGTLLIITSYVYIHPYADSESILQLLEDNPDTITKDNDKLSRSNYAEHIAKIISNSKAKNAVAIAITSEWGFGKTTFLRFIESELRRQDEENNSKQQNLIVHFNPWKFEKSEQILSHFFEALESEFKKIDDNIVSNIRDYSNKLGEFDDSIYSKFFSQIFQLGVGNNKTLSDRYQSLNKSIIRSGKRIIIIMDDLDRLIGDELISVTRLIRNTADFSNTFFIAAFDQNYVLNTISTTRSSINKENYLQKIFQLEITLPPIRDKVVNNLLREYLQIEKMADDEKKRFEEVLPNDNDNIIIKGDAMGDSTHPLVTSISSKDKVKVNWFLNNIRDIKRFTNSFRITYAIIGNEVDLYDLLTLELIKYRFPSIYTLIAEEEILARSSSGVSMWYFSEEKFSKKIQNNKLSDLNIDSSEIILIKSILKELFDRTVIKNNRTIIHQSNFHLYFQYQLFNSISVQEFNIAKRSGREELLLFFEKADKNKKLNELLEYIERIIAYDSKEEFEDIICCLLKYSYDNTTAQNRINILLFQEKGNINSYYDGYQENYYNFLFDIFDYKFYNSFVRAKIAHDFLFLKLKQPQLTNISEDRLRNSLINILDELICNYPESEELIYRVYTYNREPFMEKEKYIVLIKTAGKMYKKYLKNYHMYFLRNTLVSISITNYEKIFTFNTLILEIFETFEEFEELFLSTPDFPGKSILIKYFNVFQDKSYKSFVLKEEDYQELNRHELILNTT